METSGLGVLFGRLCVCVHVCVKQQLFYYPNFVGQEFRQDAGERAFVCSVMREKKCIHHL